jgi:hypothetical protein
MNWNRIATIMGQLMVLSNKILTDGLKGFCRLAHIHMKTTVYWREISPLISPALDAGTPLPASFL